MRKILAAVTVVLLSLPLMNCANTGIAQTVSAIGGYTVTQGQLDGTESTYNGTALATLKTYATLPTCARGTSFNIVTNRCHDRSILKRMRSADKSVASAFASTQDQITSGNNSGAIAAFKTLQAAIGVAKQIISDNGLAGL